MGEKRGGNSERGEKRAEAEEIVRGGKEPRGRKKKRGGGGGGGGRPRRFL
jgi:hypothetical protein